MFPAGTNSARFRAFLPRFRAGSHRFPDEAKRFERIIAEKHWEIAPFPSADRDFSETCADISFRRGAVDGVAMAKTRPKRRRPALAAEVVVASAMSRRLDGDEPIISARPDNQKQIS